MPFIRSESCSFIWHPKVVTWYFTWATLLRVLRRAALADHGHLHLARVLELLLHRASDRVRQERRLVVVDVLRLHDHADLAAGVHGVHLLDARLALGDLLEVAQALDVVLERLAACARARA